MLSAGVPLKVTSEVFGHASVAITGDIYRRVSPEVSREALTRLSDALFMKKGGQREDDLETQLLRMTTVMAELESFGHHAQPGDLVFD